MVSMSCPIFLIRRLFFCIKPTMKVQPSSPSSRSSSTSSSFMTNWGFIQKVSRKSSKWTSDRTILVEIKQRWRINWSYWHSFCSLQRSRPFATTPQTLSEPTFCIHLLWEHLGWGCRSQGGNTGAGSQKMTSCGQSMSVAYSLYLSILCFCQWTVFKKKKRLVF